MGIQYKPAIDGLRAVAVLSVVAYHAGAPAGFVGVDVFFVISGYLITSLLRENTNLVDFYARRARRILPAAVLVVIATMVLSILLLPDVGDVARSAAAAGVFVANLHFQAATASYWAPAAESMPLLHLWSLSVEEQFYLAWPLVLVFARKRPAVLWWVFGASLALYAWLSYANPNAAFYQTPARAWELTAGALVAFGLVRPVRGGLLLVLLACLVPMPIAAATMLSVLGATMLIATVHAGRRVPILETRPMIAVGLISYSLYLWHWPLLAIDRATRAGEAPIEVRLALVGIAIVLSILSYRYVEQPFRRARVRSARAVAVGVACAAALSCTAFALASKHPGSKPPEPKLAEWRYCHPYGPGVPARQQLPECVQVAGPKVVLWGDSFAEVWQDYALRIAGEKGMPMVRAISPGCPPALVTLPPHPRRVSAFCRKHSEETAAYLEKYGADTVIVAGWWANLLRERPDAAERVVDWAKSMPNVRRILVVGAVPELRDSVEKCIELGVSCDITRAEYELGAAATKRMTAELAKLPNVEVADLGDWMCDADKCRGIREGVTLYYSDNHHASHEAVARFLANRETAAQ